MEVVVAVAVTVTVANTVITIQAVEEATVAISIHIKHKTMSSKI